uniref:Uncharacterized protein n=1 Tax=Lygus hesperus TaxID=30085 RepID=A0A146LDB6_LYGHE
MDPALTLQIVVAAQKVQPYAGFTVPTDNKDVRTVEVASLLGSCHPGKRLRRQHNDALHQILVLAVTVHTCAIGAGYTATAATTAVVWLPVVVHNLPCSYEFKVPARPHLLETRCAFEQKSGHEDQGGCAGRDGVGGAFATARSGGAASLGVWDRCR